MPDAFIHARHMVVNVRSVMRKTAAGHDAIAERIQRLIRLRGLDLQAWYLADTVETMVWYSCRDAGAAERARITRAAQLAVLAGLVRSGLSAEEYDALMDALPENLHGIFMRAHAWSSQRSGGL